MAKATQKFFDELTDQSEAKARIIEKYFNTWANVVIPSAKLRDNKIAYMDLYAGPGRYKDCLLYTSPSPRDGLLSRMPSSA